MSYPAATRWLLASHDYELDADGRHVEAHPVDAAMVVCLGYRRGTIAGSPETGNTYGEVHLGGTRAQRQLEVEERTKASAKWLLDAGLVELKSVDHELRDGGGIAVLVNYINTQTGQPGQVDAQ